MKKKLSEMWALYHISANLFEVQLTKNTAGFSHVCSVCCSRLFSWKIWDDGENPALDRNGVGREALTSLGQGLRKSQGPSSQAVSARVRENLWNFVVNLVAQEGYNIPVSSWGRCGCPFFFKCRRILARSNWGRRQVSGFLWERRGRLMQVRWTNVAPSLCDSDSIRSVGWEAKKMPPTGYQMLSLHHSIPSLKENVFFNPSRILA